MEQELPQEENKPRYFKKPRTTYFKGRKAKRTNEPIPRPNRTINNELKRKQLEAEMEASMTPEQKKEKASFKQDFTIREMKKLIKELKGKNTAQDRQTLATLLQFINKDITSKENTDEEGDYEFEI